MDVGGIRPVSIVIALIVGCGGGEAASDPQTTTTASAPPAEPGSCDRCTDTACRPEDARACADRADKWRHADGVPFDLAKHGDDAERACVHGYAPACSSIAILHQNGLGGRAHSDAVAAKWHERGCEGGAGIGCFDLAMMIEGGDDGTADPARAKPYYERAFGLFTTSCESGEHEWCASLGYMLESGTGVAKDPAAAVAAYRKGCPQHANNCANLGLMMIRGEGIEKDVAGGRKLLGECCDGGSGLCCSFLGAELIASDDSVAEGVKRLEQGCAKKEKVGCTQLAAAHATGRGVTADSAKAIELLDTACGLGDSGACRGIAEELLRGPKQDRPRIVRSFEAACNIGDAASCSALALLLERGIDMPADPERAKALWHDACRRGDLRACDRVLELGLEPDVLSARVPEIRGHACMNGVQQACKGAKITVPGL